MVTMVGTTRAESSSGVSGTTGAGGVVVMTVTGADSIVPGVRGGATSARPPRPAARTTAVQRPRLLARLVLQPSVQPLSCHRVVKGEDYPTGNDQAMRWRNSM